MVILKHLSPYLGLDCWSPQMCWPSLSDPVRGSGFCVMPEPGNLCQAAWGPTCPGSLHHFLCGLLPAFLASTRNWGPGFLVINARSLAGVFHLPRIYLWHSALGPFLPLAAFLLIPFIPRFPQAGSISSPTLSKHFKHEFYIFAFLFLSGIFSSQVEGKLLSSQTLKYLQVCIFRNWLLG